MASAAKESRLQGPARPGPPARQRAPGPDRELPFADRVIATLVDLAVPAPARRAGGVLPAWTALPLPARPGRSGRCWPPAGSRCPASPGLRLRTLADVFAYAAAQGVKLRIDGTEVQVKRRPRANRPGTAGRSCPARRSKNTIKATGGQRRGRAARLWTGRIPARPDARPVTALRTDGIEDLLRPPSRMSEPRSTPATRAWPATSPPRSSAPPKKPPARTRHPEETAQLRNNAGTEQSSRADLHRARHRRT